MKKIKKVLEMHKWMCYHNIRLKEKEMIIMEFYIGNGEFNKGEIYISNGKWSTHTTDWNYDGDVYTQSILVLYDSHCKKTYIRKSSLDDFDKISRDKAIEILKNRIRERYSIEMDSNANETVNTLINLEIKRFLELV